MAVTNLDRLRFSLSPRTLSLLFFSKLAHYSLVAALRILGHYRGYKWRHADKAANIIWHHGWEAFVALGKFDPPSIKE